MLLDNPHFISDSMPTHFQPIWHIFMFITFWCLAFWVRYFFFFFMKLFLTIIWKCLHVLPACFYKKKKDQNDYNVNFEMMKNQTDSANYKDSFRQLPAISSLKFGKLFKSNIVYLRVVSHEKYLAFGTFKWKDQGIFWWFFFFFFFLY